MFKPIGIRQLYLIITSACLLACGMQPSHGAQYQLESTKVNVERVVSKLKVPWSVAFLPECEILVTERRGNLFHFDSRGRKTKVKHGLKIFAKGQGGLLDVVAKSDFQNSREIFLSYSATNQKGLAGTSVSRGILSRNNDQLRDETEIFEMVPGTNGNRHFGSRIVENTDGTIFITMGDRGERESSQDLTSHNGTVVRINPDGTIPENNPFINNDDILPEIWSYGHRNPQGAGLDLKGNLLVSEHGPRGGDEVNLVLEGRNYGWPVIGYGVHYSGQQVGIGTTNEGMEQPELYWDPSIAPSGLMVYSGKLWPDWKGHVFVGSLKFDYISRIDPDRNFQEAEQISLPETKRVRDVREAPDGSIWFISEDRGSIYRMVPYDHSDAEEACKFLIR